MQWFFLLQREILYKSFISVVEERKGDRKHTHIPNGSDTIRCNRIELLGRLIFSRFRENWLATITFINLCKSSLNDILIVGHFHTLHS